MSKLLTPLALSLALAFGGAAYAETAESAGDVYQEAIWDIQAGAQEYDGKAAKSAASDVYEEAIWDIHAAADGPALAGQLADKTLERDNVE